MEKSQEANKLAVIKWEAPPYPVESLQARTAPIEQNRFAQRLDLSREATLRRFDKIIPLLVSDRFRHIDDRFRQFDEYMDALVKSIFVRLRSYLQPHVVWVIILILVILSEEAKLSSMQDELSVKQKEIKFWNGQALQWMDSSMFWSNRAMNMKAS